MEAWKDVPVRGTTVGHITGPAFRKRNVMEYLNASTSRRQGATSVHSFPHSPLQMSTFQLLFGQRIGVFILAEISAISAASVIILLAYIAVRFQSLAV